jgi:nucleoside-diphosphate kinase
VDRTLIIVKPEGVARGLIGEILGRFERRQLRFVAAELRTIDTDTAKLHYAEHDGRPYFERLMNNITAGPALIAVVEGPSDTWKVARQMIGTTDPLVSPPGTIRGDLAIEMAQNLIHGSDSLESAEREIGIFFPNLA